MSAEVGTPSKTPDGSAEPTSPAADSPNSNRKSNRKEAGSRRQKKSQYHDVVDPYPYPYKRKGADGAKISKSDEYPKRHSSSDDYRRRKHEELEKVKELIEAQSGFSVEFYIFSIIVTSVLLVGFLSATVTFWYLPPLAEQLERDNTFAYQVKREAVVAISEHLDCSLTMKFLSVDEDVDYGNIVRQAMMCLAVTEPHSAAVDSGVTAMIFMNKNGEQLEDMSLLNNLNRTDCNSGNPANVNCTMNDLTHLRSVHVHLTGNVSESKMFSQWFKDPVDFYRNEYYKESGKFFGETNITGTTKRNFNYQRTYRVSRVFSQAQDKGFTLGPNLRAERNLSPTGKIRPGDRMKMDTDFANSLTASILNSTAPRIPYIEYNSTIALEREGATSPQYLLMGPENQTLSVVSQFVVYWVHAIHLAEPLSEVELYAYALRAQKLAFQLLYLSPAWRGEGNLMGIGSRKAILKYIKEGDERILKSVRCKVRRPKPDRVTSLILWRNTEPDYVAVATMALQSFFDSAYYFSNKTTRGEFPRFECGAARSVPFTSAASLIVLAANHENIVNGRVRPGEHRLNERPWFVVTASGSVRTVEAVVMPVLRMLILGEQPGNAVNAPTAYYDIRDGEFYCETDSDGKELELFSELWRRFALVCHSVPIGDFAAKDRAAMAVWRPLGVRQPMQAAIDRRNNQVNYPTGY